MAQQTLTNAFDLLTETENSFIYAQLLNTQGSLQLRTGKVQSAIATWEEAETIYRHLNAIQPLLRTQINQAQALRTLGLYRRAKEILEQAQQDLQPLPDSFLKAKALQSLGVTLQISGDLSQSQTILETSLAIAQKFGTTQDIEAIQLSLAKTFQARGNFAVAQTNYQQIRTTTTNLSTQIQATLNLINLLIQTQQHQQALTLISQIQNQLEGLPNSRTKVYFLVYWVESIFKIDTWQRQFTPNQIATVLSQAISQARELSDTHAESYSVGQLGHLYEQTDQWSNALQLTQQALQLAQTIPEDNLALTWYWQKGRILKQQGKITKAIEAYNQAVTLLQSLRQDLLAVNPEIQFTFRDRVEPIYRQLVQLLLQDLDTLPTEIQQQHLARSRELIEALQLAELENFFREACLTYQPQPIEAIDPQAAVIYPIFIANRLEVILSVPGKTLQHYGHNLNPTQKQQVFQEIKQALHLTSSATEILTPAQTLYNWLIRPGEALLESQGIHTLVFVLDDILRSIPMGILHDGQQYLIQKYNLVLTPGLQLLPGRNLSPSQLQVLSGGISQARQGFSALPSVEAEIAQISNLLTTTVLLNQDFTRPNFREQINQEPFNIIHLATHGQFSSQAAETFLLTWEDRINVKELDQVLKQQGSNQTPIELLILSACETATGDNRAALGMAGIAVRSGARSTLATLWAVSDRSTAEFVSEFYRVFSQGKSKAQALKKAQLALINNPRYNHPYYWSPFVLIGNW